MLRRVALAFLVAGISASACAAPEEIQVYLDDLTPVGQFGTDVHNNWVFSGSDLPDYAGALPSDHLYRLTPEFYYGASDMFELGLYTLTTTAPGGNPEFDGPKLRVKFIAPHDESHGSFWGANLEIGDTALRVSPQPWGTELKGIYGWRNSRWLYAVNLNLDWTSTRAFGGQLYLDVDEKLAYSTDAGYQLGFESYDELGRASNPGHFSQQKETLYVTLDSNLGKAFDLNLGLGRGLTTASDRWTLKFILGIHYWEM